MPRIDVWDVPAEQPEKQEPLWVGFTRAKLSDRYDVGKQLGQGGFGSVRVVVERCSGKEYACKSITKRLSVPNVGAGKQNQHLENIRREALILRRLRGTLNVVYLEDVFEDEDAVHLVMEWCKGGELLQRINTRHYSERTAASYMRAVLRTLAQCHHLRILHRDVKPGNFMLLTDADKAPVKAIDFGLAVFYDPKKLPCKDLGLEGTPHFMAPEQLSGKTEPASDIWSAGVMAYQLLCGFVPFDDLKNTRSPALSLVWRAILTEEPKFTHRAWEGVSEEAKDFVRSLLIKDPAKRPTAKQALGHPWLQGKSDQRTEGAPLARTVVQRLQKFGVESALKRTVLDMIANDLINRHMEQLNHLAQQQEMAAPQQPQSQQQIEPRPSRNGSPGQPLSEVGEATPEGAAAAAVAGTPVPPALVAVDGASGAVGSRLRQLAAQDLLLRSAGPSGATMTKHATVHAGGDALAALRRGQQLLGLPLPSRPLPCASSGSPGGPFACALAALQHQHQHGSHQRRSHNPEKRPLGRAVTSITPDEQPWDSIQASQQPLQQRQQELRLGQQKGQEEQPPNVLWRSSADPRVGASAVLPVPQFSSRPGAAPWGSFSGQSSLPRMTPLSSMLLPQSSPQQQDQVPPRLGSPVRLSSGCEGATPPAGAIASGSSSTAGVSSYKGPVKDLAAATAWDMSFMKNRLAMEGSGHALQHYAWLLNVGERSLHGVLERSYHAGRHHSPSAEAILGAPAGPSGQQQQNYKQQPWGMGAAVAGSPVASLGLLKCTAVAAGPGPGPVHPAAAAAAAVSGGGSLGAGGGSGPGGEVLAAASVNPDYLRMLALVARQRAEHRKYQRLSLNTSGHRQTQYEELMAAAGAAGDDTRLSGLEDMAPPQEADEDEAAAGGTTPASADTTGAFPLPPPSCATSAFATSTSFPPPATDPSPSPRRAPQAQALPQHAGLQQESRGIGDAAAVVATSHPPSPRQLAQTSATTSGAATHSLKPSIPGLEEAEALSRRSVPGPGTGFALSVSGPYATSSYSKVSYSGSMPPGVDDGEGSLIEWEDDSQLGQPGGTSGPEAMAGGGAAASAADGHGKRSSLLKKVRKALMNPVKSLKGSKHHVDSPPVAGGGKSSGRQSGACTGATTPLRSGTAGGTGGVGALLAKLSPSPGAVGSSGALATVSVGSTATGAADERGRGRGAYAAFLQFGGVIGPSVQSGGGTGSATPQERSGHGVHERSAHSGAGNDRSSHSDHSVLEGREGRHTTATQQPGPAGYAIHTVKAHKQPPPQQQQQPAAAAALPAPLEAPVSADAVSPDKAAGRVGGQFQDGVQEPAAYAAAKLAIADGVQTLENGALQGGAASASASEAGGEKVREESPAGDKDKCGGGVTQEDLAPALGLLLGDSAKVAELQDVMKRLQYDKAEELTYEQLSEGLQWLGYRLEPSEVQDLLRQATVGGNEGLTASQFIASQVDWRTFQANHRAEWMDCLRKAFEDLGGGSGPDGRVSLDQLMAALAEKLPEEEVNLAVQESLMDAAVKADGVDFDAFVRIMRCNSNDSLASAGSSELSYDLYDPRLKDSSLHGPLGDGVHYHPALETVPDDPE